MIKTLKSDGKKNYYSRKCPNFAPLFLKEQDQSTN